MEAKAAAAAQVGNRERARGKRAAECAFGLRDEDEGVVVAVSN